MRPASCALHLAFCILLFASCFLHPASSLLRPAYGIRCQASRVQRPASLVQRPACRVLRSVFCFPRPTSGVLDPAYGIRHPASRDKHLVSRRLASRVPCLGVSRMASYDRRTAYDVLISASRVPSCRVPHFAFRVLLLACRVWRPTSGVRHLASGIPRLAFYVWRPASTCASCALSHGVLSLASSVRRSASSVCCRV